MTGALRSASGTATTVVQFVAPERRKATRTGMPRSSMASIDARRSCSSGPASARRAARAAGHGKSRRPLRPSLVGHDRLELAVVEALHPAAGSVLVIAGSCPSRVLRQDGGDDGRSSCRRRIVEPQAEGDDRSCRASRELSHPARDRPPALPDPVRGLPGSSGSPGAGEAALRTAARCWRPAVEIAEDQPGAVRNRRRLELVVEGLDVARVSAGDVDRPFSR